MAQPRPIDRPIQRPLPSQGRSRTVEIERVVVPSIPLVEARERFLAGLRWKTSRITGRRLTAATADKYRNWLNRFERWLIATERELDLGLLTEDDMRHMESDLLDEIDDGTLEESSASTYTRCVKTLFADTWDHLGLNGATNPALKLHAGSQQAVDFPLLTEDGRRTLRSAADAINAVEEQMLRKLSDPARSTLASALSSCIDSLAEASAFSGARRLR